MSTDFSNVQVKTDFFSDFSNVQEKSILNFGFDNHMKSRLNKDFKKLLNGTFAWNISKPPFQ